jgi:hypothetical protein
MPPQSGIRDPGFIPITFSMVLFQAILKQVINTERIFRPDLVLHQARQTLRELISLTGLYTRVALRFKFKSYLESYIRVLIVAC